MISARSVSKSFIQRGKVLNGLSLELNEGDSIAIMGPSGSGKTTLLNLIGLLDKPDDGIIEFMGSPISGFNEDESANYRNRNIGFVFQEHLLLPHLTVLENIYLPLAATEKNREEMKRYEAYISMLMKKTGITDLVNKHPFQISGGESQRVALVRALVNKPSVLLADEPTGSLDLKNAEIMGDLLVELNRDLNITIILATHSAGLAFKMKKIFQLTDGRLMRIQE